MKRTFPEIQRGARVARIVLTALLLLFVLSTTRPASAQVPTWTATNGGQAYTAYTNYFLNGPNSFSWTDPISGKSTYSIIVAKKGGTVWNTFWYEANDIHVAIDAYDWAVKNGGDQQKYKDQINNLCQGFIDRMTPTTNFGQGTPWTGGVAYNWHGTDYTDTNYFSQGKGGNWGGGGDWFSDDLMWAAWTFARAYQITGNQEWLKAAEEQVDWVWANAQAETNDPTGGTNGTAVGLMQSFCNANNGKHGNCLAGSTDWAPSLVPVVNFPFVIAADILAQVDPAKSAQYQQERNAVYAWSMANLYSETDNKAVTCTNQSGVTCAEIYASNSTASWSGKKFNGERNYWSQYPTSTISRSDFAVDYGIAIEAAVRMGDNTKAQNIANYLMYGMANSNHKYLGPYVWDSTHSYNILPYWGPTTNGYPSGYDEGGSSGSNGIALRGLAYGLSHGALNATTLAWAQANVQAAWNTRNPDNVMWNNWMPGAITGVTPSYTGGYIYNSWDCSDAVVGMLAIPAPKITPGSNGVEPVTVASDSNPSNYNQLITFTATVPTSPMAATGTITFEDNGTPISGALTISGNTATYTTSTLSVGTHQITAVYSGDDHYIGVTSEPLTQTVNKAPTTAALLSSQTPSIYGYAVTYTATVAPSTVGGTVNFLDGNVELCSGVTVAAAVATCTTSTMTTGSHSITAFYSGDSNYLASASSTISQVVNPSYQVSAVTMTPTASENSAIIFRVAVSAVDGKFNGPVVLSVSGLPANAVEFSPATVIVDATYGAESKLKIKFPKEMLDSLPNSLIITVTGTSTGQSSNAQPVILTLK